MSRDLEAAIDALYALPIERFTPERDALATRLRSQGDREGADRVKGQRKPVVAAWALNALAREDPKGIGELERLGHRLRDAQRRSLSGGDAGALRDALDERRALVSTLAARARDILDRAGVGGPSQEEEIVGTLDAAAVDERAVAALREGRLVRPLRPPSGFGDAPGLTVVPGGARRSATPASTAADEQRRRTIDLRRELSAAETRQRRAGEVVDRARRRVEEAERRRSEARDRLHEAEAELRGATLETKRLSARLSKVDRSS